MGSLMIRKQFLVTEAKAVDVEQGIYEVMISTEVRDRQGDVVVALGAKLENFLRNPVVLFAHDYSEPPVARALELTIIPGVGIRARFQFPPTLTYDFADTVHRLWAGGYLNATSIGFIPGEGETSMTPVLDEVGKVVGTQFNDWELLEFSIVPVPANQEALRLAIKALRREYGEPKHLPVPDATPEPAVEADQTAIADKQAFVQVLDKYFDALKGEISWPNKSH